MIIRTLNTLFAISIIVTLAGCSPDLSDDVIPQQPFDDIVLELTLPSYAALQTNGGTLYLQDGGVRGIIVYRQNESTYIAFERNCSYRPNEACATVNVDATKLFMVDPCCQSRFRFPDGEPTDGPAIRQLNRYAADLDGTTLTIRSSVY
ncbi:Rieske (2Fe-2S) protein [Pseudochryseolinea flava]|uniref:Rieske domain-containing protein n=1 Tax=Pseudochryseolinea flava TaxID=2059302 RepID=A0A364XZJ6_9BACT|nr:hypothetical protein [Pseudochryseolinea flava]RAV99760.1 hypothetical protein DQQ10_17085 [Pseudochryseolinea flava]